MARARILVVDDEADILAAVKGFLEGAMEVEVVTANSGAEGLEAMRSGPVDLILSDFRMPNMDGLEFLRRAAEMRPELPRVLMTAFPDMQLAISALNQAHIAHFVTKPVDPEKLRDMLEHLLSTTRKGRQRDQALQRLAAVAGEKKSGSKDGT
ncbi:MAG: response regulator [Candidatus Thermoplasmatota archaeon]